MGLREVEEIDLDLLLFGDPDSDTSESEEIICQCGHGRGRNVVRTVPRLPQAAILHRISLMEVIECSACWVKNSGDDILKYISQKVGFDISCKLSPQETKIA